MLEEDYIMRLIKEMIRAIIKVLFNVDTESPTEELLDFALKAVSRNYSCKRLNIHIDITSTIGKIQAANIPAFRLLFAVCVIYPIMYGPIEPPISPAIASSANIDVPPRGIFTEVMLIVPGHIMPTEKPQSMQPIRPRAGLAPSEVSK